MAKFAPPEQLDFSRPEEWTRWHRRFAQFRTATKLATEADEVQITTLLYALGPSADDVFEHELIFASDADKGDYKKVVDAFSAYFAPAENTIHERAQFARMRQLPGETVATFSSRLHAAAAKCKFDRATERICDHLVAHMSNLEVSKELPTERFLRTHPRGRPQSCERSGIA